MARPTKLTPEVQASIVDLIEKGNYAVIAARCSGIGETTFYTWMDRGRKAEEGEEPAPADEIYRKFRAAVSMASARAEADAVAVLREAMLTGLAETHSDKDGNERTVYRRDWRAADKYLERRHPKRWGNRQEQTHNAGPGVKTIVLPCVPAAERPPEEAEEGSE